MWLNKREKRHQSEIRLKQQWLLFIFLFFSFFFLSHLLLRVLEECLEESGSLSISRIFLGVVLQQQQCGTGNEGAQAVETRVCLPTRGGFCAC